MPQIMKAAATAALLLVFGSVLAAQTARPTASGVVNSSAPKGQAIIHGAALDRDALPLSNATIRLRNLVSGEIEKVTIANQMGEFTFIVKPGVTYVVEIADKSGKILAVGNIVSAQAGEVVGAIVSIPVLLPPAAGFLGNTAGAVISAVSGLGLTALPQNEPPASPDK